MVEKNEPMLMITMNWIWRFFDRLPVDRGRKRGTRLDQHNDHIQGTIRPQDRNTLVCTVPTYGDRVSEMSSEAIQCLSK